MYEDRITVLNDVIDNFEKIHYWASYTMAKLRYGQSFLSSIVQYGRNVFLLSAAEQKEVYDKAKKSGFPAFELESLRQNIYSTQFKNNPTAKMRVDILSQLEPLQDLSISEASSMNESLISRQDLILKVNFNSFIKRFEREEGDIVEYRKLFDFDLKIELIREKLNQYVEQAIDEIGDRGDPEETDVGGS